MPAPTRCQALTWLAAATCLLQPVQADGTYRSRPDLSPPHLNITIPCDGRCEAGYLFVAPFTGYADPVDHGPLQAAPYILTDEGDLVWSGFTYFSTWSGNFQAARWRGRDVLFSFEGAHNSLHGHGHGHHTFLDQDYQTIRELRAGHNMLSDKHEFIVLNETTALFQIYHPIQMDLSAYGGTPEQTWIVDARFQEVDIETGKVLFEWRSLDWASPDETALPLPLGQAGIGHNSSTAWDYFHINSITKGDDGHYLVSARHASTVLKVNGTDGSVIWRLGGHKSDFELGPNVTFGFQHHARYLSGGDPVPLSTTEVISLFDNSVYGSESAGGGDKEVHLFPWSRGKYIELDHAAKKATLVKTFHPPNHSILAKSQGSLQTLPRGNALINWGSEGQITEFSTEAGEQPIFHAFLDSGFLQDKLQNYRAFRYNWTGFSPETIAVVAEHPRPGGGGGAQLDYHEGDQVDSSAVNVYVSWNGDTVTKSWRLSWSQEDSSTAVVTQHAREYKRTGFETAMRIQPSTRALVSGVRVEAIGDHGRVLSVSDPVEVGPAAPWTQPWQPRERKGASASFDGHNNQQPLLAVGGRAVRGNIFK
ncbi:ASST-domain-containing protein [Microdochium trichocladiopsis]|uniref:ASST-domain-containing protein n=1 Tax=Microdochium trichocladiopsis TaxID=1682393 RepID=A0A9P9BX90_9PEZI|nr:ASST-domain-containing protein [Microdochium trichocladiopsis]KAH7041592.1 ASST-domain-containing protein [Microdochium trichocladiopsis]